MSESGTAQDRYRRARRLYGDDAGSHAARANKSLNPVVGGMMPCQPLNDNTFRQPQRLLISIEQWESRTRSRTVEASPRAVDD
jgi:hypothetical protein